MPVDDINRIGPNQDINDPSLLIEVGLEFNKTSEENGNALAKFLTEDPEATGNKIVDIIIPLKKKDGTTIDFDCKDIERNEEDESLFVYDKVLWGDSLINTYVDLAENFRDYWRTLNTIIDTIQDVDSIVTEDIPAASGSITWGTSGYLDSFRHDVTRIFFSPSGGLLDEPLWSGVGPNNYNSGTYPQLLNEAYSVRIGVTTEQFANIGEFYYWIRTDRTQVVGAGLSREIIIDSDDIFQGPPSVRLEIPNFTDNDLEITMSAIASCSKSSIGVASPFGESSIAASIFANAGYGHHGATIEYIPLDSFSVSDSATTPSGPSSSNTVSVSDTLTVTIPPHRSGFFVVHANANSIFNLPLGEPLSVTNSTSVTLNGRTRNHIYTSGQ